MSQTMRVVLKLTEGEVRYLDRLAPGKPSTGLRILISHYRTTTRDPTCECGRGPRVARGNVCLDCLEDRARAARAAQAAMPESSFMRQERERREREEERRLARQQHRDPQ